MPKPDVAAARAAAHQQIIALNVLPLEGGAGHLYQVEQDYQHGMREAWSNWSPEAKWFVAHFRGLEPLRPPRLTDKLAEELVSSIGALYRAAYPSCSPFSPELVLDHWRRTPTRSTRLLVRLTVNQLDLLSQNGFGK
ncbi:MAG: hypothetical protein JW395_0365 [Nitrospira sp.]|nr:hypothetical protein [Nitrospira sp.]